MMTTSELLELIANAVMKYEHAGPAGRNVDTAREQLKNILLDRRGDILRVLHRNQELEEEVTALDNALEKADNELRELRKASEPKKKAAPAKE